ncbi:MAG: PEP-CTERM sorting domain-containing protein [Myxococcota bacterium]
MNRLMFSSALALSVAALATTLLAGTASAVLYGTFFSPTGDVTFVDVEDLNGLYGAPVASGNSLDFSPNTFEAQCPLGGCPPTTNLVTDTLTFQVDANGGFFIEDIILSESGDLNINDFTIPVGFAAVTVSANVFVDILELDGVPVSGINANDVMTFTNGGAWDTSSEPNGAQIWSGGLDLDIDAVIANAGQVGRATLVELSIANTLTAEAQNGAQAFIEKKDIDGLAITVVPEPGTALLMLLGLGGLSAAGRRSGAARS